MKNSYRKALLLLYKAALLVERSSELGAGQQTGLCAFRSHPAMRSSHNELEKNRRAHLRHCLDSLRQRLPMSSGDACRLTIQNVLKRALAYLKELEATASEQKTKVKQLERQRRDLLVRRDQLKRACLARRRRQAQKSATLRKTAAVAAAAVVDGDPSGAADAWRSRNASEVSATSASSDDPELTGMAHRPLGATARAGSCGSPDSGYASPPNCQA